MQTLPRFPDAAEWDCVDLQGALVCRSEGDAAGLASGALEAGFVCGARRKHANERVCVDLSPDLPDAEQAWTCRMQRTEGRLERSCTLGQRACLAPGREIDGVCVPVRPEPGCWLDADCEHGERCRQGTCAS